MRAEPKPGVSGYLEAFILIGVALGGSGIVFGAATRIASSMQGASVTVSDAGIVQGTHFAFEKLTVSNTGQVPITSFTVSTLAAPTSASYCYTLTNPATLQVVSTSCPVMTANPRTVTIFCTVPPGGVLLVTLQLVGSVFAVGSSSQVIVLASAGSSAAAEAQVLPA